MEYFGHYSLQRVILGREKGFIRGLKMIRFMEDHKGDREREIYKISYSIWLFLGDITLLHILNII